MENLGERLMTQLRSLIAANHFVINKRNASIYTSAEGYTYCVSKVLADTLRDTFATAGITDVPHDNNRIFDTFGEYGFCELNSKGQVMHYIHRIIDDSSQTLSVLKFQTAKLFRVMPEPFSGQLEEVSARHQAPAVPEPEAGKKKSPKTDTASKNDTVPEAGMNKSIPQSAAANNAPQAGAETPHPEAGSQQNTHAGAGNTETSTSQNEKQTEPEAAQIATDFLHWVREKIRSKAITINDNGGMLQKLDYQGRAVIGVVSPRTFTEFAAEEYGMTKDKTTAEKIQRALHNNKHNIPAVKGQIHIYQIIKSHNNPLGGRGKMFMYLFETDKIDNGDADVADVIESMDVNKNLAHQ